jgi:tetratricopeptide (TPR) repeat protein
MSNQRSVWLVLCGLSIVATLGSGGLAFWGWLRWADARWYYHWSADYRLRRGQEALHEGNLGRAQEVADMLTAGGHGDQAALLQGEILFRQGKALVDNGQAPSAVGRLSRAIDECNKIKDQGTIRLQAASLSGQCLLYLKQPREAERALRFVLDQQPNDVDALRALAAIYFDQGATSQAIDYLERVAKLDETDGRAYRLMGLIFKEHDNYAAAMDCYRIALGRQLGKQSPDKVRFELEECLARLNRYDEVVEVLGQCDAASEDAAQMVLRATCLARKGQAAEASMVLNRALEVFPDDAAVLRERAVLHLEARQPEAALPLLQRAVRADSYDYSSHYQLGLVYRILGKTVEAAQELSRAEQVNGDLREQQRLTQEAATRPWDAEIRLRLAAVCDRLGRYSDAASWREAAAACGSGH